MITDGLQPHDVWNRWLEACVTNIRETGNGWIQGNCPSPDHPDLHPSFSASRDEYRYVCHSCGIKGNAVQFARMMNLDFSVFNGFDFKTETYTTAPIKQPNRRLSIAPSTSSNPKNIAGNSKKISARAGTKTAPKKKVAKNSHYCRKTESIDKWKLIPLSKENAVKGWKMSVVDALQVHWSKSNETLAFPMLDENEDWMNCWCHKPVNKFLGGKKFHPTVYPLGLIKKYSTDEPVYLVEGFKDVIRMISLGYQAISFTNGALTTPRDLSFINHFTDLTVIYDNDTTGESGKTKQANALKNACRNAQVYTADWSALPYSVEEGSDVSDGTEETISDIIKTKTKYIRGYKTMTLQEFIKADIPASKIIVDQMLVEKGVTLIASTDGVGKSFLSAQLGLSVVSGEPFLGSFEVCDARPVLYIQFEMEDGDSRDRLEMQYEAFKHKLKDAHPYIIARRDASGVFSEKWGFIEATLDDNRTDICRGVLIIDNIYTSTSLDISVNRECLDLLGRVEELKQEFGIAIVLVGHFNKGWEKDRALNKDQIQGGKQLTNYCNNVFQLASSKLTTGLRIGKITKTRKQKSELEYIPFKMRFDDDDLVFKKHSIVTNEAIHYVEGTKRKEIEAVELFRDKCTPHAHYKVETFTMRDFAEKVEIVAGWETSDRTVHTWLNKLVLWGLIKKLDHNLYQPLWEELDESNFA